MLDFEQIFDPLLGRIIKLARERAQYAPIVIS